MHLVSPPGKTKVDTLGTIEAIEQEPSAVILQHENLEHIDVDGSANV